MNKPIQSPAALGRRTAFTLIELMISIALVLLLMVGINQVFKVTGETVGTSQTIADGVRDARAAQVVMGDDMASIVTGDDAPFLIINSERIAAFKDRKDELGDRDFPPATYTGANIDLAIRTIDFDGDNVEDNSNLNTNLDLIPRAIYGVRNRRIDQISFFARGLFPRQTGNDGTFVSDATSGEAFIWYGHLRLPASDPTAYNDYRNPGTNVNDQTPTEGLHTFQDNPNNFYSSQWILGRAVMLLREPQSGQILDDSGVPQTYIGSTNSRFAPVGQRSRVAGPNPSGVNWEVQWGRFDLLGTRIQDFKQLLSDWIAMNPPPATNWHEGSDGLLYRFQGWPYPNRPLTAETIARVSPTLLQHCSQFIVEYAGDFLEQDNDPASPTYSLVRDVDGDGSALEPDGVIDYIVNPISAARSIRWYGYPRDTSSNSSSQPGRPDGAIEGGRALSIATYGSNALCDVVPLRDVAMTANPPPPNGQQFGGFPFERDINPLSGTNKLAVKPDYAVRTTTGGNGAPALNSRYRCAWGPDTPAMATVPNLSSPFPRLIRFVFTIDDPSGRVPEGQTYEYVFRVGG